MKFWWIFPDCNWEAESATHGALLQYLGLHPHLLGMGKCKKSIILIGQSAFTQNLIGQRVRRMNWKAESANWESPSVNTLRPPVKEVNWEVFGVGC